METERPVKPIPAGRFPSFLRRGIRLGRKNVFLVLIGMLVIGFILVGFIVLRPHPSAFGYSSSDIVYGEKVIALHTMSSINAPDPVDQIITDATRSPSIQLSENFYDFGSVSSDQILTRSFLVANSGSSTLIIQQAFTTCGCTVAEVSAKEIPPGKAGLLTIQFDPSFHNMAGTTVRRGVIVYTNDPSHPTQEIWIQASVR